jgi:hypothetical protein
MDCAISYWRDNVWDKKEQAHIMQCVNESNGGSRLAATARAYLADKGRLTRAAETFRQVSA